MYRTVLEQKIRERRQTFEEFAEDVEAFARQHGERGTLSVRHLQRLAAGRGPGGRPLGNTRPATARLLENMLGLSIEVLLAPPHTLVPETDTPGADDSFAAAFDRLDEPAVWQPGTSQRAGTSRPSIPGAGGDGLQCSATLDGTVCTVVELAGQDVKRRNFMQGTAVTAAGFSESALLALTVPAAESTARAAGKRIGMADVEIITETIAHLRRLDHQYGSGRVREQIVQLLRREATTVRHGTYSEETGKALLSAVALAADVAGNMSFDVGHNALAQRYLVQSLNLAMSADDRLLAAEVLCDMSRTIIRVGYYAVTEHDRLRHARQAIALTRAGHGTRYSVMAMPHACRCGTPSGVTNAPDPTKSRPGWASIPNPNSPPTLAAASATWESASWAPG
jgi:hypothetical protein